MSSRTIPYCAVLRLLVIVNSWLTSRYERYCIRIPLTAPFLGLVADSGVNLMTDAGEKLDALRLLATSVQKSGGGATEQQEQLAKQSEAATEALGLGLEMLQRAHALNPLKLNTLESLKIAYEFVKQPIHAKETKGKIDALRHKYPHL